LPRFEVSIEEVLRGSGEEGGKGETGSRKEQEKERRQSALGHWKIMRGVLPDEVWENW
jgi:hypothetical protein